MHSGKASGSGWQASSRRAVFRLFLDANVLFTAAHNPRGKSAFLFDASARKHWRLVSSAYGVEEARRNIAAKYPECSSRLDQLISGLELVAQPSSIELRLSLPEKDRPVFLAAIGAKATHLLTGDLKHFGPHMNKPDLTGGVLIQTVAEFLASFAA